MAEAKEVDVSEAKEEREEYIPEFRKMNQLWHTHINPIWPEAPDLSFYPDDYSIFLPIFPSELDESITDKCVSFYFDHLKPMVEDFKQTSKYKIKYIANFWKAQAPDSPPLDLSENDGIIVLNNKAEIVTFIGEDDSLLEHYQTFEVELNAINNIFPLIPYDIILYVNTHGATVMEAEVKPEVECIDDVFEINMETGEPEKRPGRIPIHAPPPNKQLTFLTAVQFGIDNIGGDELPLFRSHIEKTILTTKKIDIHDLQSMLQSKKKDKINSKGWVKKTITKLGLEGTQTYMHSVGWRIAHKYVNRIYGPDPKCNPKLAILYVKPGTAFPLGTPNLFEQIQARNGRTDMTTRSFQHHPHIFRTELVAYLYENGYNHPLIIDGSCGGFYSHKHIPSSQGLRMMQNTARKAGVDGGKKSKNKKIKTKKIKKTRKFKNKKSTKKK